MSKVRRLYHQKYREDWERFPSFADWLCRSDTGYAAHCKICDANVLPRLASIKQHQNTVKHQKALQLHQLGTMCIKTEQITNLEQPQKIQVPSKPKSKAKRPKAIKVETVESWDPDSFSNDSILEDLLGNDDDMEEEYWQEISDPEIKPEIGTETLEEYKLDDMQEDNLTEDTIISEFDLFGKSVALQLNHMELEDALLCQERLQVVLTEFRLKILKRKAKRQF